MRPNKKAWRTKHTGRLRCRKRKLTEIQGRIVPGETGKSKTSGGQNAWERRLQKEKTGFTGEKKG